MISVAEYSLFMRYKTGLIALFFLVFLASSLVSCSRGLPGTTISGETMGTTYHITLVNPPQEIDTKALKDGIDAQLEQINRTFSTYQPDSELSRLNQAASGQWIAVSPELFFVIEMARQISEQSNGAYDVTVGPLVDLWGFGKSEVMAGIPPDQTALEHAKARVCYRCIELDKPNSSIRKTADIEIDLSSIAKGYAVDRIAETLEQRAIANYMVEIGGEVFTRGFNANQQPWQLGIESPQISFPALDNKSLQQVIAVSGKAVATSGDYRNFVMIDGKMHSHIIDPFSGHPVEHSPASVTVIAENCALADAWATAFTVLGAERSIEIANSTGIAAYFLSRNSDQSFTTTMTESFKSYLEKP